MPKVLYREVKGYSGPVIYGDVRLPSPKPEMRHVERAVWLNGEIETGNRMGSVMAADGTGMTAGDGHVATYPKELANEDWNPKDDQGWLWPALSYIAERNVGNENIEALSDALSAEGWSIWASGWLCWNKAGEAKVSGRIQAHLYGDVVHGALIRDAFTPIGGKVPKDGPQWERAKQWALAFHRVFADERTFEAQSKFNVKHLMDRVGGQKIKFNALRRPATMQQAVYGASAVDSLRVGRDISEALDLAMCVLHSFAINAPFYAYRSLVEAVQEHGWRPACLSTASEFAFARAILDRIKATKYGNWQKRWERTRDAARQSGLWDPALFRGPSGIMTPRPR